MVKANSGYYLFSNIVDKNITLQALIIVNNNLSNNNLSNNSNNILDCSSERLLLIKVLM
jgi:hypothetical protein